MILQSTECETCICYFEKRHKITNQNSMGCTFTLHFLFGFPFLNIFYFSLTKYHFGHIPVMGIVCDGILIFPPSHLWHVSASRAAAFAFIVSHINRTTSQIFVPEQQINHHVIISTRRWLLPNSAGHRGHFQLRGRMKVWAVQAKSTHQTGSLALPASWRITGVVVCHDVATFFCPIVSLWTGCLSLLPPGDSLRFVSHSFWTSALVVPKAVTSPAEGKNDCFIIIVVIIVMFGQVLLGPHRPGFHQAGTG